MTPRQALHPGERRWVSARRSPPPCGSARLVPVSRASSAAMRLSQARFRAIYDQAPGGICLLAAALEPQVQGVSGDFAALASDSDAGWHRHLDIPGIRQLGGLTTLRAALRARGVDLA